jgi:omega-amidase
LKIAQIQMTVTADKQANLRHAQALIRRAAADGIDLAMLPEMFCCPYDNACFAQYAEENGGAVQQMLRELARSLGIYLIGGSLPERDGDKLYNTSYVFDRQGRQIARHRKTHLFDIDVVGGQRFFESDTLSPGSDVTVFDTEFGRMGLCICFDFRFEELARLMTLSGAQVLFVPAAFNKTTGPAHWELLFRQRAVDNQVFTVGTSPARDEHASYVAWGHSLVCDPWGSVVQQCGHEETVAITDLDLNRIDDVRRQLPILSARRTDLYTVKKESVDQ